MGKIGFCGWISKKNLDEISGGILAFWFSKEIAMNPRNSRGIFFENSSTDSWTNLWRIFLRRTFPEGNLAGFFWYPLEKFLLQIPEEILEISLENCLKEIFLGLFNGTNGAILEGILRSYFKGVLIFSNYVYPSMNFWTNPSLRQFLKKLLKRFLKKLVEEFLKQSMKDFRK